MGSWVWLVRSSYCTLASDASQTQAPLCLLANLATEKKIKQLTRQKLPSQLSAFHRDRVEHVSYQDLVPILDHFVYVRIRGLNTQTTAHILARDSLNSAKFGHPKKSENGSAAENEAQRESRQVIFSKMAFLLAILLIYAHA